MRGWFIILAVFACAIALWAVCFGLPIYLIVHHQ